jgi:hypothetical protein
MVGVRQATYVAILLHFARKIVARAAAENPRKLKVRAWLNNGNARLLWTGSPKGSYFAERYLYQESDKVKPGFDIASMYPDSLVLDVTIQPKVSCHSVMMECHVCKE